MAHSVKQPTLGIDSGHDLMVRAFKPCVGLALTVHSLLGILSLSLPLPCLSSLSLSK